MNQTKIDYVDQSWNYSTGCTNEFPCWKYCWARRDANRLAHNPCVKHRERYEGFRPTFWPERLDEPRQMKKPKRIAVSSMGDLFHSGVPEEWIDKGFAVMAVCPQHTFLVLTKRPERMAEYLNDADLEDRLDEICHEFPGALDETWHYPALWPLPNVWVGTSVSNQADADERIPALMQCPGNLWVRYEPIQGPVLFRREWLERLGWVVAGGGPFPVHPNDVRSVRDQCVAANVPFWWKQWGAFAPEDLCRMGSPAARDRVFQRALDIATRHRFDDGTNVYRIGRKAAGNLFDGREWHEVPNGVGG